jgi:hypothetical protein
MAKIKNLAYIILELVFGLGFGILGALLFSLFDKWDLFYSVLFTFVAIFVTIPAGVGLVGYFHLRHLGRQKDFGQSFLLSMLGLLTFIVLYLIFNSFNFRLIPYYINSVLLPILLPLTGTVIGFNYRVLRAKDKVAS